MRIQMATPAPPNSLAGNRITADRWARFCRELGHRVSISTSSEGITGRADLLVAFHAVKSAKVVRQFRKSNPRCPVVVVLTGTDIHGSKRCRLTMNRTLDLADKIVGLHDHVPDLIPPKFAQKAQVIIQSAEPIKTKPKARKNLFEVSVVGHLRAVKDPFRAAMALRYLPTDSKIHVTHAGRALSQSCEQRARKLATTNSNYDWVGEISHRKTLQLIARSRLCILSSRSEGGASVLSEAIVNDTPVLASRIPANVGVLSANYPGFFDVGNERQLAELLFRCEMDVRFLRRLRSECRQMRKKFSPTIEKRAIAALVRSTTAL